MNTGFKFHFRFTGPLLRHEITNRAGEFASADTIEKAAENFFASLKKAIEESRMIDRDGLEATLAKGRADVEARKAGANQ